MWIKDLVNELHLECLRFSHWLVSNLVTSIGAHKKKGSQQGNG